MRFIKLISFTLAIILSITCFAIQAAEISVGESITADSDLSPNLNTPFNNDIPVFGSTLFQGNFSKKIAPHFNPEYRIAIGDTINLKIWGSLEYQAKVTVDSQGYIFIPKVGVVPVAGVANKNLIKIIKAAVHQKYNQKLYVYANAVDPQPVWVFVTGNVNKPGLYQGMASDSILQFIDKAKGINLKYGSFRKIDLIRNNQVSKSFDLYRFLIQGKLEQVQFHDGDSIVVGDLQHRVTVAGDVKRPFLFEFPSAEIQLTTVLSLSLPNPTATNVTITNWTSKNKKVIHTYPLDAAPKVKVKRGTEINVMADHNYDFITVTISGEHDGLHSLVLPKMIPLDELIPRLNLTSLSQIEAIQVFRKSVAKKQKQLLLAKLQELESLVLTSSSVTREEAEMRSAETKSVLNFIERAKKIEPRGQIIINEKTSFKEIIIEDGDQIYIPRKNNIIVVQGEVAFPGAHTYVKNKNLKEYIEQSGGLNERANKKRILLVRASGKVLKCDSWFKLKNTKVNGGDSILVLPKLKGKYLQVGKDLTQIIYQIAVGAGVIMAL
ncbi:MAG: polysaccharide export protein [Desulfobacteraceae bacterium]|nr:polysaccharide export protein [Desulfobacteraceae bacterium]